MLFVALHESPVGTFALIDELGAGTHRYWPRDILFENFPQRQGSLRR